MPDSTTATCPFLVLLLLLLALGTQQGEPNHWHQMLSQLMSLMM